jgi:hypothetical protein
MGQCSRCGGWNDGYGLCPECKRNDDLAEEQRSIAYEQVAEQERIQRQVQEEAHLNEIKRKLLDHAIEGLEDRATAAQKVAVLMRSSDFSGNLAWFWGDVSANAFLSDVYFGIALGPLTSTGMSENSAVNHFDSLDYRVRGAVGPWLEKQASDSAWTQKALPFYRAYQQVLHTRQIEQQKENEESARRSAEQQAEYEKQRAKEAAEWRSKERSVGFWSALGALGTTGIFLGGYVFGGSLKLATWLADSNYAAVSVYGLLALVGLFVMFGSARDYTCDWLKNGDVREVKLLVYWSAVLLILFLTWRSWNSTEGPVRLALIAAAFGLPFVPLLRGAIGSFALGIAGGLLSLLASYIAGGILSGIFGWIMTSNR